MTEQQLSDLEPALATFLQRFIPCCRYSPTFAHLGTYVRGLLSDLPRKSVEPMALKAGTPVRSLQEFLKDHVWDFSQLRDQLTAFALEQLPGAVDPQGLGTVAILDETSALKKGTHTPGVQRQYLGCVGKVANGIVTVHLALAKGRFKTLIDSDLFLPESWSDDRQRCRDAGIPDELVHRPKWQIGLEQIDRATNNGVVLDWLCFDEEYGKSPAFIRGLDERGLHFVGEVPRTLSCLVVNRQGVRPTAQTRTRTAEEVVAAMRQFRDQPWTVVRLSRQTQADQIWRVKAARVWLHGGGGWLAGTYWLIWASNDETGEEKFFISNASAEASVDTLVRVAFMRWNVEHCFRVAKSELGFTHFEGRNYEALMRHMSLCLVALGFVAVTAESMRGEKYGGDDGTGVPSHRSGGGAMVGGETRQQPLPVRQQNDSAPPKTQSRGAGFPSKAREPTAAPSPQETPTSKAKAIPTVLQFVNLAL